MVSTPLGLPIWYELMTTDTPAAETFYKKVIGWTSAPLGASCQPYTVFKRSDDVPVAGVRKLPDDLKMPPLWTVLQMPPMWTMCVAVPTLEEAADQIKRL